MKFRSSRLISPSPSGQIDAKELQKALVNGNWSHFSEEACRMMINMFFCWKVKSIFKLKMIINCFVRWGEVANLNIYQMKYISSFRLLNISSLTLIYFKEQTYLWWSNRTFTEIFLTMWLPAQKSPASRSG